MCALNIKEINKENKIESRRSEVQFTCADCFFIIPDMDNISFATGVPILGSCKYSPDKKVLMSDNVCEHFKKPTDEKR